MPGIHGKFCVSLVICAALCLAPAPAYPESANAEDIKRAQAAIALLGSNLKKELQTAMHSGGPLAAIETCRVKAPALAQEVVELTHLDIRRVGTRVRNPANQPEAWEREVLDTFATALEQGKTARELTWSSQTGQGFRYMQGIVIEPVCLQCHGEALDETLLTRLHETYPNDRATGYQLDELRGAFVVKGLTSIP